MKTLGPSIVRTLTPIVVGYLLTIGIFQNADSVAMTEAITALLTGVYYLVVRVLEHYVSGSFGWLLGYAAAPTYRNDKTIQGELASPPITGTAGPRA